VFLPYGETLQRHRKVAHQVLKAEASISYHEMYFRHSNELVMNLLNATTVADDMQKHIQVFVLDSLVLSSHFQNNCNRYTASLIMAVTYGRITHGNEDPFLVRARELLDIGLQLVTPEKAAILTTFPFRKFHNHSRFQQSEC